MISLADKLPGIAPTGIIEVDGEKHRYQTYELDDGSTVTKEVYTLDKAPVKRIQEITGVSDNSSTTFVQGTDYELVEAVQEFEDTLIYLSGQQTYTLTQSPDIDSTSITDASGDTYSEGTDYDIVEKNGIKNVIKWLDSGATPDDEEEFVVSYTVSYDNGAIKWLDSGDSPDPESLFYVTYRAKSVFGRYIGASDEEFEKVQSDIEQAIASKFVDQASGNDLDNLGQLFGDLGKRRGRSDTEYRIYLKSVVKSFISRGTVNGIKTAISAATDVPLDEITINENFDKNQYEVQVKAATPITGQLLENISKTADPSGVGFARTRFTLPPDEMGADETIVRPSERNQDRGTTDTQYADETVQIDPNLTTTTDTAGTNETVSYVVENKDQHLWEPDNESATTEWGFFEWAQ